MNQTSNAMRREAARVMGQLALPRVGIVTSYDPDNYAAKVEIQPENIETGWLPIAMPWSGNGWGMFAPPTAGDVVDVHFQEGAKGAGIIGLRHFGDVLRPLPVPSGEFWLVHQSGSLVKLTNDGKLTINGKVEIDATAPTVNITATTSVNVTAPAINLGSIGQTLHKMVTDAFQTLFNSHTHPDAQGGNTGSPNQTLGDSHLTTVTSAG